MLAFIHIHKTGGQTIEKLLRYNFGVNHLDVIPFSDDKNNWDKYFNYIDLRLVKSVLPGLKSIAGHKVRPYSDLNAYDDNIKYFTFLREPISRCVSQYQYEVHNNITELNFDSWINRNEITNWQTKMLSSFSDPNIKDAIFAVDNILFYVGLVEYFDRSLCELKELLSGMYDIELVGFHKNQAKSNTIKKRILKNEDYLGRLKEANQKDIVLYEYVLKHIFKSNKIINNNSSSMIPDIQIIPFYNKLTGYFNLLINFFFRNLFYKPWRFFHSFVNN